MAITRRDFCKRVGSALAVSAAGSFLTPSGKIRAAQSAWSDLDPAGGFTLEPPRQFIFTDWRHIDPSAIAWRTAEGKVIPVAGPPEPPVPVFADSSKVPHGIRLQAQRGEILPPEAGRSIPGLVVYDNGMYRSWSLKASYAGKDLGSYTEAEVQSIMLPYGESKDGFDWQWRDTPEVKLSGVTGIDGNYVFIDDHGLAEERYKCIYHAKILGTPEELNAYWKEYETIPPRNRDTRLRPDRINGLFGLVSPDGINWKPIPKPLLIHMGDTDNTVYYDRWLEKYVLYTRLDWMQRRQVARAESDDFYHWSPVSQMLMPRLGDPPYVDIYTNARTSYPGMPEHHLMFPFFYNRYTEGSEVHMYSSLDGVYWDHVPGGPVLTTGEPGEWNGGFMGAGKHLVPLGQDKIALPYSGVTHPHKYPRWKGFIQGAGTWAVWPKGRLCGVIADEEGSFQTFSVPITGKQLRINAKIRHAGEIRVGLIKIKGRSPEDCDPIAGDSLAHPVTWKGDASLGLDDTRVRLQFKLRLAELYGFEWV